MTPEPDFRELVGDDLTPDEEQRLRRAHELLLEAGPLPELSPKLAEPSTEGKRTEGTLSGLPRRRTGAALALAAAIALIAFLGGYLAGYRKHDSFNAVQSLTLHGTSRAPGASALVEVGKKDSSGNLPMQVTARGLKPLPGSGYYTLALTKNGRPVVTCGTFRVPASGGSQTVRMAVAYDVGHFDGWVVTEYRHGSRAEPVVLRS